MFVCDGWGVASERKGDVHMRLTAVANSSNSSISKVPGLGARTLTRGPDSTAHLPMSAGVTTTNLRFPSSSSRARPRSVNVASAAFMAFASRTQPGPNW